MTINEYQKKAHEFAKYGEDTMYPVLGLAEEAGEVAGKYAKLIRDDNGKMTEERFDAIVKELGDVCWMVAEICTNMDMALEDVMYFNIKKLTDRKARNVINGSGDNR